MATDKTTKVIPTIPKGGELAYSDLIEVTNEGGTVSKTASGTTYRATRDGEAPTHFPTVPNYHGRLGFVINEPRPEPIDWMSKGRDLSDADKLGGMKEPRTPANLASYISSRYGKLELQRAIEFSLAYANRFLSSRP